MAKPAADIGRAAHLPEQPGQAFGARRGLGRQKRIVEFLGKVHQDGGGLEDADRLWAAAVDHRRDLRVRVDRDKPAAELIALADADQPGIVFGALVTQGQQLLEHDRHFDAIRGALRVELERVAPDRQLLLVLRAGGRAVDVGKPAVGGLVALVPSPDLGRRVVRRVGHS